MLNAMDGVPHLTQAPIAPGESFAFEFSCPDAGTFWYHPHQRSHQQIKPDLSGAFNVEELQPIAVDRDVTSVLDDWRLLRDASISDDFANPHDASHNGPIGNRNAGARFRRRRLRKHPHRKTHLAIAIARRLHSIPRPWPVL